jgi:hypothetical protein
LLPGCGTGLTLRASVLVVAGVLSLDASGPAAAQTAGRDTIADLIRKSEGRVADNAAGGGATPVAPAETAPAAQDKDPREGDPTYEQARGLMGAIDAILKDVADERSEAKKLPGKDDFIVPPIWTETKEDRDQKVRRLLDSALAIVTDVPIVDIQKRIEGHRKTIREIEDRIVELREKQLTAPKDSMLPGVLSDTVSSLGSDIEDSKKRIEENRQAITAAKAEIETALKKSGVEIGPGQLDLILDSVLSGDLVRLVATFNAAKLIDGQLANLMTATGDNISASRKYFAMHAALFAMLVQAQDAAIAKIDMQYMPRLDAILKDIAAAKAKTNELMRAENRPDQARALEANRESQKLAEEAAKGYRRYLAHQREQIAQARTRATHDLRIADNTYETVEASFQLRDLMRDSSTSFEAIQKLEAPTFDQIFKNEELRREFENLTRKLDAPTS